VGNRYSKEELGSIEPLILEGLTNREIASRLGRSEAGIRNVRYRHKLKRKTEDSIRHLHLQKEKIESEINELKQTKTRLSNSVRHYTSYTLDILKRICESWVESTQLTQFLFS